VVVAASADDVPLVLRWARNRNLAVTARGSGSSMAGGAVGAGVILDLSRLRSIEPVDTASQSVCCEPGALRDEIDAAARAHGLRFPVDPSSGRFCTIGGMVATNAAGAHSLGFGAMHAWVTALECVLADGSVIVLRRGDEPPSDSPLVAAALRVLNAARANGEAFRRNVRKDSSGYGVGRWLESGDLLDVIVASEGTLAIVTAVELRLAPVAQATTSLLAAFSDLDSASDGARAAREAGAVVCELLDSTFLELTAQAFPPLPAGTSAVLLAAIEAESESEARKRALALQLDLGAAGATATTLALVHAAQRELWELRHSASPILAKLDERLRSVQVIEDGAVPPEALAAYVRDLRTALEQAETRGVIFGHAGDAHVHVNPLVDMSRSDWRDSLNGLIERITATVARLGGTVSGEHGDGRLRAPLLARTWPAAAVQTFRELKDAFDPDGLLNPGVILPIAGQSPIEAVKYDPALPPLPAAARVALDQVADRREYAASRLSLLEGGS
jgi:FAD/FMN-containing dehydrogenase